MIKRVCKQIPSVTSIFLYRRRAATRYRLLKNITRLITERVLEWFAVPREIVPGQSTKDAVAAVALVCFDGRPDENLGEVVEDLFCPTADSSGSTGSSWKRFRMKPRGVSLLVGVGVRY